MAFKLWMLFFSITFACCVMGCSGKPSPNNSLTDEEAEVLLREQLAGIWRATNIDGNEVEPGRLFFIELSTNTIIIREQSNPSPPFEYEVDPSQSPIHFDMVVQGSSIQGIVELKGDEMKLCTIPMGANGPANARPKAFGEPGSNTIIATRVTDENELAEIRSGNPTANSLRPKGEPSVFEPFLEQSRVTIDIEEKPLPEALAELGEKAGVSIQVGDKGDGKGDAISEKTASLSVQDATIWQAIHELVEPIGGEIFHIGGDTIFVWSKPPKGYESATPAQTIGAFHLVPEYDRRLLQFHVLGEPRTPGFTVKKHEVTFDYGEGKTRTHQNAKADDSNGDHDFQLSVIDYAGKEIIVEPKAEKVTLYAELEIVTETKAATTPPLRDFFPAPKPVEGGFVRVEECIPDDDSWGIEFILTGDVARDFFDPEKDHLVEVRTPEGKTLPNAGSGWTSGDLNNDDDVGLSTFVYKKDLGDVDIGDCFIAFQAAGRPLIKFGPLKDYRPPVFKAGRTEIYMGLVNNEGIVYSTVNFRAFGPVIPVDSFRLEVDGKEVKPHRAYSSGGEPTSYTIEFDPETVGENLREHRLKFSAPTQTATHGLEAEFTNVKLKP